MIKNVKDPYIGTCRCKHNYHMIKDVTDPYIGTCRCKHNYHKITAMTASTKVECSYPDDQVPFVLDQHAQLDFDSVSSLKQQSADKHATTLGHIILIPSQPDFALSP